MEPKDFLAQVADPAGIVLCYTSPVTVGKKANPNRAELFTGTADNLGALLEYAAKLSAQGRDLYFTPARIDTLPRNKANVISSKSLWIDVDVREGKGYASLPEALDGIKNLCVKYRLPVPTIVMTGGGFHVYWTCETPMTKAVWEARARVLHTMVKDSGEAGLCDDTARITDISSMMRLPGFKNHKRAADAKVVKLAPALSEAMMAEVFAETITVPVNTPKPTTTFNFADRPKIDLPSTNQTPTAVPFDFSKRPTLSSTAPTPAPMTPAGFDFSKRPQFNTTVDAPQMPPVGKSDFSITTLPPHLMHVPRQTGSDNMRNVDEVVKPTYAQVLSTCNLLRWMTENPNELGEPEWKLALNVVAQTVEGRAACHEFSQGYHGYSAAETDEKVDHIFNFGKPATCATLAGSKFDALCSGCPRHGRKVSPLKAATSVRLVQVADGVSAHEQAALSVEATRIAEQVPTRMEDGVAYWDVIPLRPGTNMQDTSIKLTPPPPGYVYGNITTGMAGVFDLSDLSRPITKDLIWVDRRTYSMSDLSTNRIGYRVNFIGASGEVKQVYISGKDLGRSVEDWLNDTGLTASATPELIAYIKAACDAVRAARTPPLYVAKTYGWYKVDGKHVFIAPTEVVNSDGTSSTLMMQSAEDRFSMRPVDAPEGRSMDAWKKAYAAMFTKEHYHAHLITMASLASVLFHVINDSASSSASGMMMALTGMSSSGKSWVAKVCQTIWQPVDLVPGNSTLNGLVKEAVLRRHIPLYVDDMTIGQSREERQAVRDAILMYTSGREKSRAASAGVTTLDKSGVWSNVMVVTSNESFAALLDERDPGGGASARIFEIGVAHAGEGETERRESLEWAQRDIQRNYGVYGVEFVRRVMRYGMDNVVDTIKKQEGAIREALRVSGARSQNVDVERIRVQVLAMCAVAAQIMGDAMPFDANDTINWAVGCLRHGVFMVGKGAGTGNETNRALLARRLSAMVHALGNKLYVLTLNADKPITLGEIAAEDTFIGPDGRPTVPAIGSVQHNREVSAAGHTPHIIEVIDYNGKPVGYYFSIDYLNAARSSVTARRIMEVFGETPMTKAGPTMDDRKLTVSMSTLVSGRGRGIKMPYLFITDHELEYHLVD